MSLLGAACRREPSCEAVGDHALSLMAPVDDHARDLRQAIIERCNTDEWPAAARRCILETTSTGDPKGCREHLNPQQSERLDKAIAAADLADSTRTVPRACTDYEALVAAVQRCADVPADLRTTLATNLELARAEWATMPDKRSLAPVCSAAITRVKEVVPATCGR